MDRPSNQPTATCDTPSPRVQESAQPRVLPHVNLCGLTFARVTERQCVAHVLDELDAGRGGWVVTPNLDILRRWVKDESFRRLIEGSTVRVADGMPLVWASRLQGTPLPQRVAGSNLISSVSSAAAERGRSIYLLGGDEGTAQAAAEVLRQRHPTLRVAGTYYPEFGFEHDPVKMAAMRQSVLDARPDIVFVALGCPKQERIIAGLRDPLPQSWFLGVGISFSFLCGRVRRAPKWMQRLGLEWIHRLLQEPGRLAKRYLLHDIPFALRLLAGAFSSRIRGGTKQET